MPKKFRGENSKAVVAKERKANKAADEKAQRDKAAEDALWVDDDKSLAKKNARKEEKERKRLEDLKKKQELKDLVAQEEATTVASSGKPSHTPKVTQYQLQQQRLKQAEAAEVANVDPTHLDTPLVENTNRLDGEVLTASGIEGAIKVLNINNKDADSGTPSGRVNMAAAFRAFEENRMPGIKKENPTLKLSQLKQRLRKEWQKSPENPLNRLL